MESCIFNECPLVLKFASDTDVLPYLCLTVRTTPAIEILVNYLKQLHVPRRSTIPFIVGPSSTFVPSYLPIGVIRDTFHGSVLENFCVPLSLHFPEGIDRKITDSELDTAGRQAFTSSLKQALFFRTGSTKAANELSARQESTCWDVARLGDVSLFDSDLLRISQSNVIPVRIVMTQKMATSALAGRTGVPDPASVAENKLSVIPYAYSTEHETTLFNMIIEVLDSQAKYHETKLALRNGSLEVVMHGYAFGEGDPLSRAKPSDVVQRLVSPDGFLYIALREKLHASEMSSPESEN